MVTPAASFSCRAIFFYLHAATISLFSRDAHVATPSATPSPPAPIQRREYAAAAV
jgi:hypothetical protein